MSCSLIVPPKLKSYGSADTNISEMAFHAMIIFKLKVVHSNLTDMIKGNVNITLKYIDFEVTPSVGIDILGMQRARECY